ncbi:MAG: hypothetical protein JNJ59_14770 [Deltaproteobacteria bacterium]|nr:hypothetical protein [Deltaproteobacteria bacterium]
MTERSRSQRLHAALSALATHGLPLALDDGQVAPPRGLSLLRVEVGLWPGAAHRTRRGRGRPRKTAAPDS